MQVAHDVEEYHVNFHYPFAEEDVVAVLRRYGVELAPGEVSFFKPNSAAMYTIPAPAEMEVNQMVHQLFSRLYNLGETYAIVGSVE